MPLCWLILAAAIPMGDGSVRNELPRRAVVLITAGSGAGTGVIVGKKEPFLFVLTADHVVRGVDRPTLQGWNDEGKWVDLSDAEVIERWPQIDLALVRTACGRIDWPLLPIAPGSGKRKFPLAARSAGLPDGKYQEVAERVVARRLVERPGNGNAFMWETESRPAKGRSGGPLVDSDGRLVGICSGTQDGKGYFCHLDEIHSALRKRGYRWLWEDSLK